MCFFQNRKFDEYLCKMPSKKRSKQRGSHDAEKRSTRVRSPEVDELSCVPDSAEPAGSWGGAVGGGSGGSSGDVRYRTG